MILKALTVSVFLTAVNAASLVDVSNFGSNPTNLRMSIYVPDRPQPKAPIVLTLHGCQGNGPDFFRQSEWPSLADRYGFIVISPTVSSGRTWGPGGCWYTEYEDVLTHNGGSDSLGLVNMVNWAVANRGGDASRVYTMGWSSGGMETQVLLGAYPDVFKAGASFDGVPYGCMLNTASDPSQNTCATGQLIRTAQQWGDLARSGYPEYTGPRPKVQIWHGTNDQIVSYKNLGESVKQWTNIHGISATPVSTTTVAGWTRERYGNGEVEAWTEPGGGHVPPATGLLQYVVGFFGLDQVPSSTTTTTTTRTTITTTRTSVTSTTTSAGECVQTLTVAGPVVTVTRPSSTVTVTVGGPSGPTTTAGNGNGNCAARYAQCGGQGYNGPTCCQSGSTCKASNQWVCS